MGAKGNNKRMGDCRARRVRATKGPRITGGTIERRNMETDGCRGTKGSADVWQVLMASRTKDAGIYGENVRDGRWVALATIREERA